MPGPGTPPVRQGGWAGVITLLLAVLIVALLSGTLLKHYGAPAARSDRAAPAPGEAGVRAPGAAPVDNELALPAPTNAVERARAVEETVRQQAADRDKRIDDR
jgi:hypothetical protein